MSHGIRIVGWCLTAGTSAALVAWVWLLLRSKHPEAVLGRLARAQLLFFGAVLSQSLAMALEYPSSWVGWTLAIVAAVFTIAYLCLIWPIFLAHLRSAGLLSGTSVSREPDSRPTD